MVSKDIISYSIEKYKIFGISGLVEIIIWDHKQLIVYSEIKLELV